jgi:hypothetical protein
MANNPLLPEDIAMLNLASAQNGATSPQYPQGYVFATPPTVMGAPAFRLFDAAYITTGIIDPNRLGTGSTGAGNLYLADDGTWKAVSTGGGGGDMLKATYDVDNDGVVDSAEAIQIIVRNSTGVTLTKGQVVYLNGAPGNRPNAVLSQAHTEATSSKTIGIVVANIANNSDGYVAVNGTLHNLNTSAFADGDAVWLSAVTAGAFTSTIPVEPNHTVFIGYVARAHPTQGRIVILIQNGYELNELHGVLISSEANNDLLVYETSTTLWKNKSIATIFGGTPLVSQPWTASGSNIYYTAGNVMVGTTIDAGQKLQVSGKVFIKGTTSLTATKVFEVQNGAGESIMDFRDNQYAFFGCGQGGGSATGFIFNYSNVAACQFSGYNYGGGSGAYKPILLDTDIVGRSNGVYVNFSPSTYPSTSEFGVRAKGDTTSDYIGIFKNNSSVDKFAIRADGALFTNTLQGYSGTLSIPGNPPGSNTITITNGLITNIA